MITTRIPPLTMPQTCSTTSLAALPFLADRPTKRVLGVIVGIISFYLSILIFTKKRIRGKYWQIQTTKLQRIFHIPCIFNQFFFRCPTPKQITLAMSPPSSFPVCHLTQIGTVHHGRIVKPIYTKKFFVKEGMRLRAFLGNILSLMRKLEQQTGTNVLSTCLI